MRFITLCALMSACLFCHAESINVKKLHKTKWLSIKTENFEVITDAGEKKGKMMAEELERFSYFLTTILRFQPKHLPERVPIVLAKSSGSFANFGLKEDYAGIFSRRGDQISILANGNRFAPSSDGRPNEGRQIILHEIVHLITLTSDDLFAVPPWFAEGVAEYFGTYAEKKNQVILGQMSLLQYRFLDMQRPSGGFESIDVENLLKANSTGVTESNSRKSQRQVNKFYARSFALVHYLNADPERRKQMYIYLHLLKKGHDIDASFNAAFETTYEAMTKEVDNYIDGRHVYARVFDIKKGGIEFPETQIEVSKIQPRAAMQFLATKLSMIGPPFIMAEDHQQMFEDIRKIYPDFSVTF